MIFKRLLQLNLIVSTVIAITFILAPETTLSLYGITGGDSLFMMAQYFGTTHIAFAVLLWLALRAKQSQFLHFLVVSFFAGDLVGTIVLLIGQLNGLMNAAGWGFVGLSFLFALGYGIAAFRKSPDFG